MYQHGYWPVFFFFFFFFFFFCKRKMKGEGEIFPKDMCIGLMEKERRI